MVFLGAICVCVNCVCVTNEFPFYFSAFVDLFHHVQSSTNWMSESQSVHVTHCILFHVFDLKSDSRVATGKYGFYCSLSHLHRSKSCMDRIEWKEIRLLYLLIRLVNKIVFHCWYVLQWLLPSFAMPFNIMNVFHHQELRAMSLKRQIEKWLRYGIFPISIVL